jgi:hypothetical protein
MEVAMRLLKFLGGSVVILYFVCAVLAVMSFPASAAEDGVSSFAWIGAMIESAPVWLSAASMVIATASGIAAITPTPKDDGVLLVARKILDVLALNVAAAKNQSMKDKASELVDRKRY